MPHPFGDLRRFAGSLGLLGLSAAYGLAPGAALLFDRFASAARHLAVELARLMGASGEGTLLVAALAGALLLPALAALFAWGARALVAAQLAGAWLALALANAGAFVAGRLSHEELFTTSARLRSLDALGLHDGGAGLSLALFGLALVAFLAALALPLALKPARRSDALPADLAAGLPYRPSPARRSAWTDA